MLQPALLTEPVVRHELSDGAWVDVGRGWWTADDGVFERLRATVCWKAERRPMYDRIVDVPRLVAHYEPGSAWPEPALATMRDALNDRYAAELGEELVSVGLCWYRDGADSVAWHGDTIGRARLADTVVAIVSFGATRTLALRPRRPPEQRGEAAPSGMRLQVRHGDLLAMGGSCQRTWEHAVPKTARPVGERISVQFRARGVR